MQKRKRKRRFSKEIIIAFIGFLGVLITALLNFIGEIIVFNPSELESSSVSTELPSTSLATTTVFFTPSTPTGLSESTNKSLELLAIKILSPLSNKTYPLFKDELNLVLFSPEEIIVEFLITDITGNPINTSGIFASNKQSFDAILYFPNYDHINIVIEPVNKDSALNNHYLTKIDLPTSGGKYLEGDYLIEIKTDNKFIKPNYNFQKQSHIIQFNIKNTLDIEGITKRVLIVLALAAIASVLTLQSLTEMLNNNETVKTKITKK